MCSSLASSHQGQRGLDPLFSEVRVHRECLVPIVLLASNYIQQIPEELFRSNIHVALLRFFNSQKAKGGERERGGEKAFSF